MLFGMVGGQVCLKQILNVKKNVSSIKSDFCLCFVHWTICSVTCIESPGEK